MVRRVKFLVQAREGLLHEAVFHVRRDHLGNPLRPIRVMAKTKPEVPGVFFLDAAVQHSVQLFGGLA